MRADIDSRARAEVGERDISRTTGVSRQEVGRLPDPAAGAGHIDRVARRVRRIHSDRTDLAGAPVIAAGPTAVHCSLDKPSVWPSVKMRKLSLVLSLPCSPKPVVGSGFWKLSDQPLNVPTFPATCSRVIDDQRPCSLGIQALKRRERHLRVERGEERGLTVLNRRGRVVIEDGIGEIRCLDATPDTAEQRNRDLAGLAHVIVQRRGEVGIMRIGEVDLDPQPAHS